MTPTHVEYNFGLVLVLDGMPELEWPENLTEVTKSHITLIGGASLKEHKKALKPLKGILELDVDPPTIEFGRTGLAYQDKLVNDTMQNRETFFVEVLNQEELRSFVDEVCQTLGIENPESDRFFHLSVANNFDGKPFNSVSDISAEDLS